MTDTEMQTLSGAIVTLFIGVFGYLRKVKPKVSKDGTTKIKEIGKQLSKIGQLTDENRESLIKLETEYVGVRDGQKRTEGELQRVWKQLDENSKLLSKMIGTTEATMEALIRELNIIRTTK